MIKSPRDADDKELSPIRHGLLWVPTEDDFDKFVLEKLKVQNNLNSFSYAKMDNDDDLNLITPTKFYENEFTEAIQYLINLYGKPNYKEANPMVSTTIMFPFLFGVMFGDIFHGLLLTFLGIWMIFTNVPGKWTLFLMGFFSFYCGLIYNDFNAMPLYLFGQSCWESDIESLTPIGEGKFKVRIPKKNATCNYAFGIDPIWYLCKTKEITYVNSFKMKMAVILGVGHMLFGTCHHIANHLYNKDILSMLS